MSEDTGFTEPSEVPDLGAEPEPETPAEPAPAEETPAEPEPAEAVTEPPVADQVAPPFIPAEGVAPWLRDVLLELHQRIRNAGF